MRAEHIISIRSHLITTAIVFIAAVIILFACPVRADAAGSVSLCGSNIDSYADGQWHSAGNPSIYGWTSGRFKLSGSTIYLEDFIFERTGDGSDYGVLWADHDMTVHISGNNSFGNHALINLTDENAAHSLVLEGDSGSSIALGSINTGNLTVSSGVINCRDRIRVRGDMVQNGGRVVVQSNIDVKGSYTGTGGILRPSGGIIVYRDMNVSGAQVTTSRDIRVSGNLTASAGSITVNDDEANALIGIGARNMTVSGTAKVTAILSGQSENDCEPIYVGDMLTVNGGEVYGETLTDGSIHAANLTVNGGTVAGKGQYKGISVDEKAVISGGTVYGESKIGGGVLFWGDVDIQGGVIHGKRTSEPTEPCSAIEAPLDKLTMSDDMWIAAPSDGYLGTFPGTNTIFAVYGANGQLADEAVIKKVSDISVSTRPATVDDLYSGDSFDPAGLVLTVSFEDGSTTALSYNDVHKDMFAFGISPAIELTDRDYTQQITSLTKRTFMGFSVKKIGTPVLSGTVAGTSADLSWTAADGAEYYRVFAGITGSGRSDWKGDTTSLSFTQSGLEPGESYDFTVYAVRNSTSNAQPSNVLTLAVEKPEEPEVKPVQPAITPPKKEEPSGAGFGLLQAKALKVSNTSVKIGWKKVPGARKYIIYGNKCGSKNPYKKQTTTTNLSVNYTKVAGKKVQKGTYYKFVVYAVDANGKIKSTSKTVHVATTGGKVGNDKKVTTAAKKGKVTIKKGKTFKLKAKAVPASKKLKVNRHRGMAYESSNKKIATVTSKGVIKGVGKGTCYVYAYTQNGVFAKVKVTVK